VLDVAPVAAELQAAGEAFGPPLAEPRATGAPALRWGLLFDALDGDGDQGYVTAIELIYEGYLYHYRESRVSAPVDDGHATALLAGDYFYARGLRLIAARGDAQAVGLLARLMAACSYLRGTTAPFADDAAVWAYTMGGLAALRRGVPASTAAAFFERFDAAVADEVTIEVRALARASARRLGLRDTAPLDVELAAGEASPAGSAAVAAALADADERS
jgi:hypothetical protein